MINVWYKGLIFKLRQNGICGDMKCIKCILSILKYLVRISEKLSNLSRSSKCYCSVLTSLLNGKKIPCIPLVFHKNKHMTDFKEEEKSCLIPPS